MTARPRPGGKRIWRILQLFFSLAIVFGIFAFAIPKIADYHAVWRAIAGMTWFEITTLVGAMVLHLITYWPQQTLAMPGLTIAQAAVNNQTSTSIANTLPGGGLVAVGVSYAIWRSWGFTNNQIALSVLVTGIWNMFMKLGLPIVALVFLAIEGQASGGLLVAAVIGAVVLLAVVVGFTLVLWKKAFARRIGKGLGRALSLLRVLFRGPPVAGWDERAVRFRGETIDLVTERWVQLTVSTVVSHLALFLVLLLALRHVGISEHQISTAQVLGVFAFGRLITALPITPGGVGIAELGYIAGLLLAGRDQHAGVPIGLFQAQIVAAVLVFRALSYGFQIPLGGFAYLVWRRKKSWRKPIPVKEAAAAEGVGI
jgi:putative heme transporter